MLLLLLPIGFFDKSVEYAPWAVGGIVVLLGDADPDEREQCHKCGHEKAGPQCHDDVSLPSKMSLHQR